MARAIPLASVALLACALSLGCATVHPVVSSNQEVARGACAEGAPAEDGIPTYDGTVGGRELVVDDPVLDESDGVYGSVVRPAVVGLTLGIYDTLVVAAGVAIIGAGLIGEISSAGCCRGELFVASLEIGGGLIAAGLADWDDVKQVVP